MVMSKIVTIHERATGSTLSSPRKEQGNSPVVPNVKVLGIDSKNGRKYPLEVMEKSLQKYEGAIVNIDHPAGSEPRKYEDRFGRLTNARLESDGIYADLTYNPKHPLAEGFEWWVQNDPKAIGLSHNAQAKTKMSEEGVEEIEEIVQVDSVDLVAEPATTAGLLEAVMTKKEALNKKLILNNAKKVWQAKQDTYHHVDGEKSKAQSEGLPEEYIRKLGVILEMIADGNFSGVERVLSSIPDNPKKGAKEQESMKNTAEGEIKDHLDSVLKELESKMAEVYRKLATANPALRQRGASGAVFLSYDSMYKKFKDFQKKVDAADRLSPESVVPEVKEQPEKQFGGSGSRIGFTSWRVAVKKKYPGAKIKGDIRTAKAVGPDGKVLASWDGSSGNLSESKQNLSIKRKLVAEAIKKVLSQKGAK